MYLSYVLYDADMDRQMMGISEVRENLGKRVDAAHFLGEVTVIEKNGEPRAVLVPYEWWQRSGGAGEEAGT